MNPANLVAFIASVVVGVCVLYANPKRSINRAFFLASLDVAVWLMSLEWLINPTNPNPVLWLRISCAIGALIPFLLWIMKDCAKGGSFGWGSVRRGWQWLGLGALTAALCFTAYFIPPDSTREHPVTGVGWTVYVAVIVGSYVVLLLQGIYSLRTHGGIHKIELQVLLIGGTAAGLVGVVMSALGPVLGLPTLPHQIPIVIFLFYCSTAWGLTTKKILDARDILNTSLRIGLSIAVVAALIGVMLLVNPSFVPRPLAVCLAAIAITLVFNRLNRSVLRATLLGGDRGVDAIRTAMFAAGRDEFDPDVLARRFTRILGVWGKCENAYLLTAEKNAYVCGEIVLAADSPEAHELERVKWATPESLERQRDAGGRRELQVFMRTNRLGVMVSAPSNDGNAPFVMALEQRRNDRPYTWSEIKLLHEWVGIIENTLSRISLTRQARESEQLKTAGLLGASLAHEIRNPLVTLKTIAQSASSRFNDPEFRRLLIELVPAEIERIEGLVSGLMDLGRPQYPHFERVHLNEIVESSVKLVRPKALDDAVALTCVLEANPDEVNADRGSIRQVILNLVMNAIQAVAVMDVNREVTVRTRESFGSVILEVADNGPGMPAEVRRRLFQPFTTSNKTSGIGLGLAITADLVKLHHGQITLVERDEAGTTFRVTLPCQQPLS